MTHVVSSYRPQRGHRRALHRRGDARRPQRRHVRLRRRPAHGLGAGQLLAEHDHARLRVERPGDRRVRDAAARDRRLRRHQPAAAQRDHRDRGRRIRQALRHQLLAHLRGRGDRHHRTAPRAGREHAHAAGGAQPRSLRPDQAEAVRAQDARDHPRDPDREALHQERDLHDLLQPDVPRPRRLRCRGGVAALFQQVEQAAVARRSGAHRRHLPVAGAAEPVRGHEARHPAPQRRAAAAWPTNATSRRQRPTPPRRSRSSRAAQPYAAAGHRAVLRRGSAQASRTPVRREGALRKRPRRSRRRSMRGCRRSPTARSSTDCARYDKRHGWRRPTRNVIAEKHTIEGFKDERWIRPIGRRRRRARRRRDRAQDRRRARLRIGPYHADLEQGRLRLDAPDLGGRPLQAGRPRRGRR